LNYSVLGRTIGNPRHRRQLAPEIRIFVRAFRFTAQFGW
jgi:hypothetical protein